MDSRFYPCDTPGELRRAIDRVRLTTKSRSASPRTDVPLPANPKREGVTCWPVVYAAASVAGVWKAPGTTTVPATAARSTATTRSIAMGMPPRSMFEPLAQQERVGSFAKEACDAEVPLLWIVYT